MDVYQNIKIYKACEYDCFQTRNIYWIIKEGTIATNIPTLEDVYPIREDIKAVFSMGVKALRFNTTGPWSPMAYEFVQEYHPYSFDTIQQKSRNQTRRGLERCEIRTPKDTDLIVRALEINQQTLTRQSRETKFLCDKRIWQQYISTLLSMPDVFPYAAYVDDEMVAYVLVLNISNKIVLYHPFMDRTYSKYYPMNALIFSAINCAREKVGPLPVSYGFGSIWNIDTLDHFKLGMGFEKIPRLRITLFKGIINYGLNWRFNPLIKAMPVIGIKLGQKYERLVEEKELGLQWWQNPTIPLCNEQNS